MSGNSEAGCTNKEKLCKLTKKVARIAKGTTGNITLYAKWQLDKLNINKVGNEDMIWSWWWYPQVVSYANTKDNVYWGFTTSEGYSGVASYNNDTKKTEKTYLKKTTSTDDHNAKAVTVIRNGKQMRN